MRTSWTVSEARASLPQILEQVTNGEQVTITRHGKPVAAIVRPDLLRVRHAGPSLEMAAGVGRMLEEANALSLDAGNGLSVEYAEDLVADVRHARERN